MVAEAKTELIREARLVAVAVIPVALAFVIGQIATFPNLTPWYAGLAKPVFNPPNWIFGPVWTTLFGLMAFAVWRVLRLQRRTPTRRLGVLNAAWSWMFFAAHSPTLGLLNIVPQLLVIAVYGAARRLGHYRDDPEFLDLVGERLMLLAARPGALARSRMMN